MSLDQTELRQGGLASLKETVSLDFPPPQTFWGYLKVVPCHVPRPDWAQAGGALASLKETVSLDFTPQTFRGYLKFVPCHVPRPDWAQAGGALPASKETVSLDFPLKSFEAIYNLSLVMSIDQTELRHGGELAYLKGSSKMRVFLFLFLFIQFFSPVLVNKKLFEGCRSCPFKVRGKKFWKLLCSIWVELSI